MAAERPGQDVVAGDRVMLQWGRDRMAAERWMMSDHHDHHSRFNGAATGWPRNACGHLFYREDLAKLQWGRDRMAAERTRRRRQ